MRKYRGDYFYPYVPHDARSVLWRRVDDEVCGGQPVRGDVPAAVADDLADVEHDPEVLAIVVNPEELTRERKGLPEPSVLRPVSNG